MDWYKTKNIIIAVLIMLNIALFAVLWHTNIQYGSIKSKAYDDIIILLDKNNIALDKKLIPSYPDSFTSRYIERAVPDKAQLAVKLLGNGYSLDREKSTYTSGSKSFTFQKDSFDYTDNAPNEPFEEMTEKYIKNCCYEKMKEIGLDYKLYSFSGFNKTENNVKAIFTPHFGKYSFFDSYISFEISENGIASISGKNLILSKTASKVSMPVYDLSSVLLDLCSNQVIDKTQINRLVSIKLGCYIGNSDEIYSNVLVIPVWQLAFESGSILYYDARNGKLLQ